jgi:hypothetical protein
MRVSGSGGKSVLGGNPARGGGRPLRFGSGRRSARRRQRLFGSQRALKTVEDFTEFEQSGAYFDGDMASAKKKGLNMLDRTQEVQPMAQMQELFDFPPTPKLRNAWCFMRSQAPVRFPTGSRVSVLARQSTMMSGEGAFRSHSSASASEGGVTP